MRLHVSLLAAMVAAPVFSVHAAALQRTDQNVDYLFERGHYVEIGTGYVMPSAKGTFIENGQNTGHSTGNITKNFNPWLASAKVQATDHLAFALAYEQPFGVTDKYGTHPTSRISGMEAETLVHSVTALAGWRTSNNFWVYGGPVYYSVNGSLTLPSPNLGYRLEVPRGSGWGYVAGVAYEKPDIALRAALTYHSSAKYEKQVVEELGIGSDPVKTDFDVRMPQSVNLDFRTGIMPKTALITGVRWVNWKQFKLRPQAYSDIFKNDLISFSKNSWEYKVGIGRQLSDKLAGQVLLTYDTGIGAPVSPLNPTNRSYGVQVGAKYQINKNIALSAGLRHLWFKKETTSILPFGEKVDTGQFSRTRALGLGVKLGMNF